VPDILEVPCVADQSLRDRPPRLNSEKPPAATPSECA
jgi:hypothetical protein